MTTSTARSRLSAMMYPEFSMAFSMISLLGVSAMYFSMYGLTFPGSEGSDVTRRHAEDGSCSAWATRSMATKGTSAPSSARTHTSEGPAGKSMSTLLRSIILAPVTNTLPGPTIFCTGSIVFVPRAMAAMAWAPPVL